MSTAIMPPAIINALQCCPQFSGFTDEELALFANRCELASYIESQTVFSFGREADTIFIVSSGSLRLHLKNGAYKDFSAGELFGELSAFSKNGSLGAIKCLDDSELVSFSVSDIFEDGYLPLDLRYRFLQNIMYKIIHYFYNEIKISSAELHQKGEGAICEFKGALNDSTFDRTMESIIAFANSKGGTILVGVSDDRTVVGVNVKPENFDPVKRSILEEIKRRLGQYSATLLDLDFQELNQRTIIRIDVSPSPTPFYCTRVLSKQKNQKNQELLIVRTDSVNTKISNEQEINRYIQARFK